MFHGDFDPYEILERCQLAAMSHEQSIEELQARLAEQAKLMEMIASQTKHLTNAVIGLQQQNKLLNARLDRWEGTVHD